MKKLIQYTLIIFLFGCDKAVDSSFAVSNSGQGGSLARFTVVNNYLYTVDKENMKVFDISNPAQPVLKRTLSVGFEIETIFPFKDKLFVGSTSVIHIFNIDDPSNPQKLSEAISPTVMRRCDPVVARDSVAYATLRTNGVCGGTTSILAVYDIKDVKNPVQKMTVQMGEPYGLGYSDSTLYVCDHFYGLSVYNIRDAYNPKFVKNVTVKDNPDFIDVIPYNNILVCWVSTGMILYDISAPENPILIKQIS